MTERAYDPADPRLTAYVLGELDDADRQAVEQQIEKCAETKAAVADIREAVGLVTYALAKEPAPTLTETQRAAVTSLAVLRSHDAPRALPPRRRKEWAVVIAGLTIATAAVCLVVLPPLTTSPQHDRANMQSVAMSDASHGDPFGYASTDADDRRESMQFDVNSPVGQSRLEGTTHSGPHPSEASESGMAGFGGGIGGIGGGLAAKGRISGQKPTDGEEPPVFFAPSSTGSSLGLRPGAGSTADLPAPIRAIPGQGRPAQQSPKLRFESESPLRRSRSALAAKPARDDRLQRIAGREKRNDGFGAYENRFDEGEADGNGIPDSKPGGESAQTGEFTPDLDIAFRQGNFDPANEQYHPVIDNPFLSPAQEPLSTFSIDVDTASYSNVRRFLKHNQWPPADAVRIEELVNYFHYDYPEPADGQPFSVQLEAGPCPWNSEHRLVRIGLKGKEIDKSQRPPSNLVFLLDVSGSMRDANKLPLVKTAMEMLVGEMTEDDRIAIVTYAGNAGLALDSTSGQDKTRIIDAIHALNAGGSTNGEAGIKLAYEQAVAHFIDDGANRVILCTDGDFNVGTSGDDELVTLIQDKAKSKVFLSVFGFGMGNIKDGKLEQIANKGNGHYGYIDNEREAHKVFVEELTGTLYTIAKDVKIQVEFNPQQVGAYRLIGYENRLLAAPDFNDDTKDAGEIGAGHTVTALYEIVPFDKLPAARSVDDLKYQKPLKQDVDEKVSRELMTLKLRYKQPEADESVKIDFALTDDKPRTEMPSVDFEWAASVAGFGMLLRNSPHRGQADFELVRELAQGSKGDDPSGRRQEFLDLVQSAQTLRARQLGQPVPPPASEAAE